MKIVHSTSPNPIAIRRLLAFALAALLLSAGAAAAEEKVVARVDGATVTLAEVEHALAGQLVQLERQRHEMLANGVRAKVQEILINRAAEKREMTADTFMAAEVDAQAAKVTAEEVQAFYAPRAGQIRQPLEQVEGQIRRHLAYQAVVEGLESAAEIEYLTEPFRVDVPDEGPSKGPADAKVTIVEYGDFECPPCARAYGTVKKVRETYGDKVQIVFQQFPLDNIHPHAQKAAEASLCAHDQGKFWELHDFMFENQQKLAVEDLKTAAASIDGLDTAAFAQCLESDKYAAEVAEDFDAGQGIGVGGTPTFFVNGRLLPGIPSFEDFVAVIEEELGQSASSAGP